MLSRHSTQDSETQPATSNILQEIFSTLSITEKCALAITLSKSNKLTKSNQDKNNNSNFLYNNNNNSVNCDYFDEIESQNKSPQNKSPENKSPQIYSTSIQHTPNNIILSSKSPGLESSRQNHELDLDLDMQSIIIEQMHTWDIIIQIYIYIYTYIY